jgi:S-adenosylmethionine-dependent methyltransferase
VGEIRMDDIRDIGAFYDNDPAREHRRLEQNQLEYDLMWRYLERYLPAKGSILEIGAATGRYTLELAKRGYQVTAVDLSAGLLEVCQKRIAEAGVEGQVTFVVADARDLSQVTSTAFDAVLMMGPLYHLIMEADRKAALREASDRLREGGIIFTAFLSRFGTMSHLIRNNPGWIEVQAEVQSVLHDGKRPDDFPRGGFRAYFAPMAEIVPLHETLGFETLTVAGVEPIIGADDESYNKLEGQQRQLWLDLLYTVSTEPSIIGASRHVLYVGKK